MIKGKNILFAVSSLGLGHATREMSTIKHLAKNNRLFIISFGGALKLLQRELEGHNCTFYDYQDYPPIERGTGIMYFVYGILDTFTITNLIKKEHKFTEELVEKHKIDFIISDCRYGCYSRKVPSFATAHQVNFAMPKLLDFKIFRIVPDWFNYLHFKNFTKVMIPDFKDKNHNLAGLLSHNWVADKLKMEYVGIISSLPKIKIKKDIDYLFIISGFLKEHQDSFLERLLTEAKKLKGKKVFVVGDMTKDEHKFLDGDIELYSHAVGDLRNKLLNRAKVIVSRSGYTTIMDLVEIDATGVLIPTPNQTEQEYLAKYYIENNSFVAFRSQHDFTLTDIDKKIKSTKIFRTKEKTADSVKKIERMISKYL